MSTSCFNIKNLKCAHKETIVAQWMFGQESEPSQATDMALACCFLGQSLRGRLPLLSPAFRHSNLRCQVPPRLHDAKGGTMGENIVR